MKTKDKDPSQITIYDIANASGVSPGTVSRAMNNIGYVKEETRQKIEEAAKKLKYTPNRAARTLKTKKTGLILLAIPDTDNPFFVDMIKAVQDIVKHNGYSLVLYYTESKIEDELKALRMLHEHFADGMILINLSFTQKHLKEIETIDCPLVLSNISSMDIGGREEDRFDYIGVDSGKGIYLATKHLIMQGHNDIAYIAGDNSFEVFKERYGGYRKALIESGIKIKEELVFWKNYSELCGYEAVKHFLSLKVKPTAICSANDMMAVGAISALDEGNIKIPDEISIIGMDNIHLASKLKPKLSSVSLSQSEIGRTAVELIFDRLSGKEKGISKRVIFEPRIIVRESSVLRS